MCRKSKNIKSFKEESSDILIPIATKPENTSLLTQTLLAIIIASLNVSISCSFVDAFFGPVGLNDKAYFNYKANNLLTYENVNFGDLPRLSIMKRISALKQENDVYGTQFDNTWLTYGTDYVLAVITFWGYVILGRMRGSSVIEKKGLGSAQVLMFLYGVSVLCGGICHQFFHLDKNTLEPLNLKIITTLVPAAHMKYLNLNGFVFRILWTVCVGSVTAAGGAIGSIGNAFQTIKEDSKPVLQNVFWIVYSIVVCLFVIRGEFSLERPAADIFLAGATQTFPTCYLAYRSFFHYKSPREGSLLLNKNFIFQKYVAFFLNAPLLPLYIFLNAILTNKSLNIINLILHSVLCATWCGQFLVLKTYFTRRSTSTNICITGCSKME